MRIEQVPDEFDPRWIFGLRGRSKPMLVLSKQERTALARTADIMERARTILNAPDSDTDYEMARLEHAAREWSEVEAVSL